MISSEDVACRIINKSFNTDQEREVFLDPVTLSLVIGLVIDIIKAIQECRSDKTDDEIVQTVHNPSNMEKRLIKRAIRRKVGLIKYWRDGNKLFNGVLSTGNTMGSQEVVYLLNNERRTTEDVR